ncbi:EamA family transporter [Hoeflea sp.]|uniref:EamA family transporter n=1 Tax=Hoeflea sp. TaxID=1940281 RepID=UPI003B5301F2
MLRTILITVLGPMLWGTSYVNFTEFLPTDHPFFVGAIRALAGGLLLLAINPRIPAPQVMARYAVLGTLNMALFFALLFVAAGRMPGGLAATLGAVQPLIVIALSSILIRRLPHPLQVVAGIAGVVGVGLLVLSPSDHRPDLVGVLAAIGGTCSMAVGTVLIDRWGRDGKPLEMATWQLVLGGLILLPVAWIKEGLPPVPDGPAIGGYLWLILLGTAFSYYVWNRGITRLGPSGAYLALASPVVATLIGTILMSEIFSIWQWAGIVLVLGAIALGVSVRRRDGVNAVAPPLTIPRR